MNRWIITALAACAISAVSAAPGCGTTGVGDPCIPDEEYDPTFQGFSIQDVSVESKSYVCLTRLCLVNHFQGRVTCPYGQTAPGVGPVGATGTPANDPNSQELPSQYGCGIPGAVPVNGALAPASQVTATNVSVAGFPSGSVPPQITGEKNADRTANKAVYCSCHCANVEGNTNDGENYCTCPDNYTCTQLVSSISMTEQGLTGGYCVLNGTAYNPATATDEICTASQTDTTATGYCPTQY